VRADIDKAPDGRAQVHDLVLIAVHLTVLDNYASVVKWMSSLAPATSENFSLNDLNPVLQDCQAVLFSPPGRGRMTLA
jgi:hypothetical protein